ncbi:MAG: permease-like cell division protein FtsX [Candidatus Coprovivens sp.]
MKAIRIFVRNIGSALKSITRNLSLSFASIICTTITLLIVGIALVLTINVNNFTDDLEGTMTILVFVKTDATEEELSTIKSKILEIKNIKSDEIIYKDKETIKQETLAKTEDNSTLYTILSNWKEEDNTLESEFVVTVKNIEELSKTAETLKTIDNVTNVIYSESVLERMIPVFNAIKKVTWIIIAGLIVVTVFLICNTIRLTVFARRNEIDIMRLVGNSNFVIKLPFVIEGLFLGIIGSIIPIVSVVWGYIYVYDKFEGYLFTNFIKMIEPIPFTIYISLVLLAIGSFVGMIGSYVTVKKHLKI